MVLQPAIWAGTAIMSVLLGSTAVPPGTYKPTAPAWQSLIRSISRHEGGSYTLHSQYMMHVQP